MRGGAGIIEIFSRGKETIDEKVSFACIYYCASGRFAGKRLCNFAYTGAAFDGKILRNTSRSRANYSEFVYRVKIRARNSLGLRVNISAFAFPTDVHFPRFPLPITFADFVFECRAIPSLSIDVYHGRNSFVSNGLRTRHEPSRFVRRPVR